MNPIIRSTRKYTFKKPDLLKLRELGSRVTSPEDFQAHHGRLLSILQTKVEEGVLNTLVQFYDPLYHCFLFPDFILVPTLEEYSDLVGLPVSNEVPFHGLEPNPEASTIAKALHLDASELKAQLTIKGKPQLQCLPTHYLFQKASLFAGLPNNKAFHSILALLIYGLLLFPNIDNFVDINAIKIFLTKNPVPTLLADTYHSIHDRNLAGRGVILCCAPLLYKWFTSHLPRTQPFIKNPEKLPWSQRIMSLTPADIVWYNPASDTKTVIIHCGDFPNVPLIGIWGGISYNPILAQQQLGYPVKAKPLYLDLSSVFYHNHDDYTNEREKFIQAWHAIHRKERSKMGKRSSFVHSSYTEWVIDRATTYKMPYTLSRVPSSTTPAPPLPVLPENVEEFQYQLAEMTRERNNWKRKYEMVMAQMETKDGLIEQKDREILKLGQLIVKQNDLLQQKDDILRRDSKRKKEYMDMFAGAHPDFEE